MCVLVEPRRWNSRGNEKTSRDISEEDFLSVSQPYSGSDIEKINDVTWLAAWSG